MSLNGLAATNTPTIFHPYARRPACKRGTGIVVPASGETNGAMNKSLRHAALGLVLSLQGSDGVSESLAIHPWGMYCPEV
jgi:hypothetical protein